MAHRPPKPPQPRPRPARLIAFALLSALAAVALGFLFAGGDPFEPRLAACRSQPSADCLADLGVDLALADKRVPGYVNGVGHLASIGRFDDAHALEMRSQRDAGKPGEEARKRADRRLASHRLAAAIREGRSLDAAIAATPGVDPGVLSIAALDLLGRYPYGWRPSGAARPPDAATVSVVRDIAAEILASAAAAPRPRTYHFVNAANLFAYLGDRDEVLRVLAALPATDQNVLTLEEPVFRVAGAAETLAAYRRTGASSPHALLRAAGAAEHDLGDAYLREAFDAFATRRTRPDFTGMTKTVQRSAEIGHMDLAREQADRLARLAETSDTPFRVFNHIYAAEALLAAGAPPDRVRASLATAERLFPKDPGAVVAVGLVGGAYRWNGGLGAEARRSIARMRATLGDLEDVRRMMDGIEHPVFAWNDALSSDIPAEHLPQLLAWAGETMAPEDLAFVTSQHAGLILRSEHDEAQRRWAVAAIGRLMQGAPMTGPEAPRNYASILLAADSAGDASLAAEALRRLARAAIDARDWRYLLRAAHAWEDRFGG